MARPLVGEATEYLYRAQPPFAVGDESRGWPLLHYCKAICAMALEQINVYVADRDDQLGWVIVLDPDNAPAEVLPYLGQYVGVELEPLLSEEQRRAKILQPAGFARGTPRAFGAAPLPYLTGSDPAIRVEERFQGSPWKVRVRTLASQTPDPARVLASLISQKPKGIVLTYEAVVGQDWADLDAGHADWAEVETTYEDWLDLKITLPPL